MLVKLRNLLLQEKHSFEHPKHKDHCVRRNVMAKKIQSTHHVLTLSLFDAHLLAIGHYPLLSSDYTPKYARRLKFCSHREGSLARLRVQWGASRQLIPDRKIHLNNCRLTKGGEVQTCQLRFRQWILESDVYFAVSRTPYRYDTKFFAGIFLAVSNGQEATQSKFQTTSKAEICPEGVSFRKL